MSKIKHLSKLPVELSFCVTLYYIINFICRVFLVQFVKPHFHLLLSGHGFMAGASYSKLRLQLKNNVSHC